MVASTVKNGKDRLRKGIGLAALLKSILLNENNFIGTPVIIQMEFFGVNTSKFEHKLRSHE